MDGICLLTVQPSTSPSSHLCAAPHFFRYATQTPFFFFFPLPPPSDSVKHFITCAVFQQPWPVLKYKVYHILGAKSLVSTPAWGDPEDKCSFPEWFIMLRLHYLAFGVWQNKRPLLFNFNSEVNIAAGVLDERAVGSESFILYFMQLKNSSTASSTIWSIWLIVLSPQVFPHGDGLCELWRRRLLVFSACTLERLSKHCNAACKVLITFSTDVVTVQVPG